MSLNLPSAQMSAPLLGASRSSDPIAQARTNMAEGIRTRVISIFTWLGILQIVAELTAQIWVLVVSWPQQCDQPLRVWVVVRMTTQIVSLGLDIFGVLDGSLEEPQDIPLSAMSSLRQRLISLRRGIDAFYLFWFVTGNIWILRCVTCEDTAPDLYKLCLALILLHYFMMALPLAVLVCLFTCLPVVIVGLAWFSGLSALLGRQAAHRRIVSLPTIRYRPDVCPEDDATCVICQARYEEAEELRQLPCKHLFHMACIDQWLKIRAFCPLCRRGIADSDPPLPPV